MTEPRGMSLEEAAAYAGCRTVSAFKDWVRNGIMPRPIPGTRIYDRKAIDAKLQIFGPKECEPPQVYFVSYGQYIKIGWTSDLLGRIAELQKAAPEQLSLLLKFPGSKSDELRLHHRFAHLRLRGEWFKSSPEILGFIEQMAKSS